MSGNLISFIICSLLLAMFLSLVKHTQQPYVKQTPVDVALPNNCVRYEIVPTEVTSYGIARPEILYSCPNATTTTLTTHSQGKVEVHKRTIVMENTIYEEKVK